MITFQIIRTGESFRIVPTVFLLHNAELNLLIQQRRCCCICEAGDEDFACGGDGRGQQERHSRSAVICNYTRDSVERKENALYTKQDIPVIWEKKNFSLFPSCSTLGLNYLCRCLNVFLIMRQIEQWTGLLSLLSVGHESISFTPACILTQTVIAHFSGND